MWKQIPLLISKTAPLSILAALTLTGCAGAPKPVGLAPSAQAVSGALPEPTAADYARPVRSYTIGPNDKLAISVFGVPELQRELQVDGSGRFSFPLIGMVQAAGRAPSEVGSEIEARLRGNFVRDPEVTVNLVESVAQTLTVDGQVVRPGMYPVVGEMTLQRAVAVAGGPNEFARLNDVVVRRRVGEQTYLALYSLEAIRRGNYQDPEVFPSDVIVVGDSPQRRLFVSLLQILPVATTPLVLLLQNR